MYRILLYTIILVALAACAPAAPSEAAASPTPELFPSGDFSVRLIQTGGFAGVYRWVTVDADGLVSAGDERADQAGSLQLSPEDLARVRTLTAQAAQLEPERAGSECADCFEYELVISIDEGDRHILLNDTTLPGSGFEELIGVLQEFMAEALG
jgi:hypothetical protein